MLLARTVEHLNGSHDYRQKKQDGGCILVFKVKRILAHGESVIAPSSLRKGYVSYGGCSSREPLNTSAVLTIIDKK